MSSLKRKLNRTNFQQLAKIRLKEAKSLLDNGFYDGAYYLSGYAIECSLKACIAKQTSQDDFPNKDFVNKCWCHNVEDLLGLAELTHQSKDERKQNQALENYWNIVKGWSEESRYSTHNKREAQELYEAIADKNGVLNWIKKYW